jgi:hypothetical protein
MKRFLTALGLGMCACSQPVSGLVVTIDTHTPDEFAFDVVWGFEPGVDNSIADNYGVAQTVNSGLWSGSPTVVAVVSGPAIIDISEHAPSWTSTTQFLFGLPLAEWEFPGPDGGTRTFSHAYLCEHFQWPAADQHFRNRWWVWDARCF